MNESPATTARAQVLARAIGELGAPADPTGAEDYLRLIEAAAEMEDAARSMLRDAVTSARIAGATWAAIGSTLGMSKQAAQKRFAGEAVRHDALNPDERILGPITATFDEMKELALAGRYGWHSVEFGPQFHRVVRSDTQWEHRRVTMLFSRARELDGGGWQLIGTAFPFAYYKRQLATPALREPTPRPGRS